VPVGRHSEKRSLHKLHVHPKQRLWGRPAHGEKKGGDLSSGICRWGGGGGTPGGNKMGGFGRSRGGTAEKETTTDQKPGRNAVDPHFPKKKGQPQISADNGCRGKRVVEKQIFRAGGAPGGSERTGCQGGKGLSPGGGPRREKKADHQVRSVRLYGEKGTIKKKGKNQGGRWENSPEKRKKASTLGEKKGKKQQQEER